MNGCKVYQMPISVANQHTKENIERRVCVPKMHTTKTFKLQRAVAKTIRAIIKITVSIIVAFLMALWAIPFAYAERGYYAVGGEWILILLSFGFAYWGVTKYMNHIRKETLKCRYAEDVVGR